MSAANKPLAPKLRFPEFRGAALRNVRLGDVTEECRSRNGTKHSVASVMGVTKSEGIVPMEARLISADIARYKLVENDWFAYNPMRLNIGSIARWKGKSEILISPDYVVFKCITEDEPGIAPGYLDHFRQTKAWKEFVTEGGDGSVRVRIYYKDIARIGLALPPLPEQQKIADCLGSLDDLIAAHQKKLDALQDHKKGLLQQLFPAEGETTPKLRFPGFEGEWEEMKLRKCVKLISGVHLAPEGYGPSGTFPYFTGPSDFTDSVDCITKWTERIGNLGHAGDTLITVKGSGCGSIWGLKLDKVALGRQLMAIRPEKIDDDFLFHYIATKQRFFEQLSLGNLIPGLSRDDILDTKFFLPIPAEQQKIADCLSALDTLITAQTEQITALKQHKKGLMQQMFPNSEGK